MQDEVQPPGRGIFSKACAIACIFLEGGGAAFALQCIDMGDNCRRHCTVLIAEDEEALKMLATLTIKAKGYDVLAASTAEEALQYWEQHADEIVLFFTDIVMSGELTGFDAARRMRTRSSALPVVFCSGHTGALAENIAELQKGVAYLPKPYRQVELGALISTIIEANRERANSVAA
jgi:CheY-like chemotaxis protein